MYSASLINTSGTTSVVSNNKYHFGGVSAMSQPRYANEQDRLERSLNSFATQSFRDQADRDYITARLACRYELFPQFLWSSHQAIEKYLKAILLYNRINASKVGHDLARAMTLTERLPFPIELSKRSVSFIEHLAEYGEFRYIDVPYYVDGHVLVDLDLAVWEVRRYCQVLDVFGKLLPPQEQALLDKAKIDLSRSAAEPRHKFRLHGGLVEKILEDRKHPSRPALLWQNPVYGVRKRDIVHVKRHLHAQNPLLTLYPEMLDELLKLVKIPQKLADAYRTHLANIKANPQARP
jgi:HEPN domain-containing protein